MDTKSAATKILAAVPGARFSFTDYDLSLSVAHPTKDEAWIVYQVPRHDSGQPEFVGDVDKIITALLA